MSEAEEGSPKNVWGQPVGTSSTQNAREEPIVRLVDIMSEDLAETMNREDEELEAKFLRDFEAAMNASKMDGVVLETEGMTDEELAIALQRQFDREEEMANNSALSENGQSFHVAPDRYLPKTPQFVEEHPDESDGDGDDDDLRQLATDMMYAKLDQEGAAGSRIKAAADKTITKHDLGVTSARNADKTLDDKVNLKTGDMVGDRLSSKVYNSLRSFAKAETKKQMRIKDKEEKATMETSVDAKTRLELFKWINQGVFDIVSGVIATGKESAVLHAEGAPSNHFAIKVYKTTLTEFKNRSEYVKDDFRFKNPRGVLKIWAEREFMNLSRMTKCGLPCPQPLKLKRHLLVMSLVGERGTAAPRLKNVDWDFLTDEERQDVYSQVEMIMCRMYNDCQLVHADLSEFNLLLNEGKVYVIDVSQAMDLSHPRNLHFLTRDIENILTFFARIGTPTLPTAVQLFNLITQLEMVEGSDLNVQVEQFSEENRAVHLRRFKSRPADIEWEKYEQERKANRGVSPARDYN